MILALDVGNSQIYAGLFDGEELKLQFRRNSKQSASSDELGLFLKMVIRENGFDPKEITKIALCSVVPDLNHSLIGACRKYFDINPFVLQPGSKTGLKIRYRNPVEVGSDRIANAIGAISLFPGKSLIIADLGTATTFCAVTADKDYLGGIILPGLRLSMEALGTKTAKLPLVEIIRPEDLVGRSTVESIQSGLYYGNLCMIRDLSHRIREETLKDPNAVIVGTGGFARLFDDEKVFDASIPELVLIGLYRALEMNP